MNFFNTFSWDMIEFSEILVNSDISSLEMQLEKISDGLEIAKKNNNLPSIRWMERLANAIRSKITVLKSLDEINFRNMQNPLFFEDDPQNADDEWEYQTVDGIFSR